MRYPRRLYIEDESGMLQEPSPAVQDMWRWVERFQNEFARQNRSPQTIIEYGYDLASLIDYLQSVRLTSFDEVQDRTLRDYLDWLRLHDELAAVTLNRRLACIRSFFKFLVEEKAITEDPARTIRKAKQRRLSSHTYLLADEAEQLLSLIYSGIASEQRFARRDLAMISLMLMGGLRVSEVAALNIEDISFREGLLLVHGKGNKLRELPLGDTLLGILSAYLEHRETPFDRIRGSIDAEATPMAMAKRQVMMIDEEASALFTSSKRRRITTRAIRMIVAKYVEGIDLDTKKNITPHKLRHTFATLLYLNGADINVLRELLGHENLSTTQIYAAVDQERKRQAMAAHPLAK